MQRQYLGELEQVVLLALLRLGDGAYGVSIRQEIRDCTGRSITPGTIYPTLDRLERKGLVRSFVGDATPERGGRAKRHFTLEREGLDALRRSQRMLSSLANGLDAELSAKGSQT